MAEISAEEYATANNNNNTSHEEDTDYNSSENTSSSIDSSGWVNIPSRIETKRYVIDEFLNTYNKWKEYESILATLESGNENNCTLIPSYVEYLLQCEEAGMKNHELPTMEEWTNTADIEEWPKLQQSTMNYQDKVQSLDNNDTEEEEIQKLNKLLDAENAKWIVETKLDVLEEIGVASEAKEELAKLVDVEERRAAGKAEVKELEQQIHELRAKFFNVTEKELDDLDAKRKQDMLQEALFQPGMKFRGRIVVPGLGDEQEDEVGKLYELVIMDPEDGCIVASHAAYDDEQYVRINLSTEEVEGSDTKRLGVEYSDGETSCSGYWNEEKFRLEGNVRQRLQANDGIFHTSEVTHVFTLYPCTGKFPTGRGDEETTVANDNSSLSLCEDLLSRDTAAIAAHRNRTNNTLRYSLQELIVSVQIQPRMSTIDMHELREAVRSLRLLDDDTHIESQLNETQKVLWKLRFVKFDELLTRTTKVAGEDTCAKFRSRAALLDSFHFNTFQDRDEFITEWKEKKIDLQGAHRHWDMVNFLMKSIAQMVFVFEPGSLNNTSPIHRRLEVSYECFESAYRRAEKRLTKEELTQYEINTDQQHQEGLKSVDCIICQMPLLDEEEEDMSCLYKLPCSHYFHKKCVEQWLHNNSTCPACRLDLTDSLDPRIYSRQRELQPWELSIMADREAFDEETYLRGGYE